MGIKPTRAETGYGYIEVSTKTQEPKAKGRVPDADGRVPNAVSVRRFTEKLANAEVAQQIVEAGNFFWNSGMFVWGAPRTLADALREHLADTAPLLEEIAASYGTRKFEKMFAKLYPQVREHQHRLCRAGAALGQRRRPARAFYCIPAGFGWNDLGSWAALYEHRSDGNREAGQCHLRRRGFTLQRTRETSFIRRKNLWRRLA